MNTEIVVIRAEAARNKTPRYTAHEHRVVRARAQIDVLLAEIDRLQAIIAARLCAKHAVSDGLMAYENGEGVTAAGGGCALCIGMRVDAENEQLRERVAMFEGALEVYGDDDNWLHGDVWTGPGEYGSTVAQEALGRTIP